MPHRNQEKIYLNALNLLFQENFLKLSSIISQYRSCQDAFNDLAKKDPCHLDPFKEWNKLEKRQIQFITPEDPAYPYLLKEIPYPPLGLYYRGEIPKNFNPQNKSQNRSSQDFYFLSVVGTRKISVYGKLVIEKLLKDLMPYHFVIVSGLALGVDTLSHKIALEEGGKTIAVLGAGLDAIFPGLNKPLSEKIIQNGALISEYPLGAPALKHHFPWRNRIISGLSPATLVIEAPEKSGALITANFSLEQNRDVFAVPGSIFNKNSLGTNHLIQKGAKLISQTKDILEEYGLEILTEQQSREIKKRHFNNQLERKIYEILDASEPILVDKIIEKVNDRANQTFQTSQVLTGLSSLELEGLIKHLEGDRYLKI